MARCSDGEITLKPFDSVADEADWRYVVNEHPASTVFHSLSWKETIDQTFSYRPAHVLILDGDSEPIGVVPLFRIRGVIGTTRVNPFCEYGYPLFEAGRSREVLKKLSANTQAFGTMILKEHEQSGNIGYTTNMYGGEITGVTFRIPTTVSFESLKRKAFNRDLRTSLKNAEDAGLKLIEKNNISEYYSLYLETMRRLGSPPFTRQFFEKLSTNFGENCSILTVTDSGRTIAGALTLNHGATTYIVSNASDPNHWEKHPNEYVYSRIIKRACEENINVVDFGRTEPNSSLFGFKEKFGGSPTRLMSMVFPPSRSTKASVSGYKRLKPITKILAPIVSRPDFGGKLKEWIHE